MNQRRKLTKDERMAVYEKTNGHCAYCGCELEYKDMQVDHVIPINGWSEQGSDTLDNMLPACRSCNHYKSRSTLTVNTTRHTVLKREGDFMRHIKCTCGLSDGNDDKVIFCTIENISYDRKEIIVREVRQCDICNRKYAVLLHYCLSYEEMKG